MAVAKTDNHFILTVPRLAGYKTLTVNLVLMLYGLASVVWPHIVTPDPNSISVLFDQSSGALVAVLGMVNTFLRLMSDGPAAPFKASGDSGSGNDISAVITGKGKVETVTTPTPSAMAMFGSMQDLARTMANQPGNAIGMAARIETRYHEAKRIANTWPFVDGIMHAQSCGLRVNGVCTCDQEAIAALDSDAERKAWDNVEADRNVDVPTGSPSLGSVIGAISKGGAAARACILSFALPFLALGMVATVAGCASVKEVSAVLQAETVEQKAFALYGSFTVVEERAAVLVRDTRIPKETRRRIQQLDKIAKPAADTLHDLANQLAAARREFNQLNTTGTAAQSKVAVLSERLASAITTLGPKITALVNAVNSARN